jgi:hypothetical protein
MFFLDRAIDLLQKGKTLRTKNSLLIVFAMLLLISFCVIKNIFFLSNQSSLTVFLMLSLLYFLFWVYYSGRIFWRFVSNKLRIYFAVEANAEGELYYSQINKEIHVAFDNLNLKKSIEIKRLAPDISFNDKRKAERYARTRMIELLVWGHALEGKINGKPATEFRLNFTYNYQLLPQLDRSIFLGNIAKSLAGRYWKILDENSFFDISLVAENITETSLFILGSCLFVSGNLPEAKLIFNRLHLLLDGQKLETFPQFNAFKTFVKNHLIHILMLVGAEKNIEKHYVESRNNFLQLLTLDPDNSTAHLMLAKFSVVLDHDIPKAKEHTGKVTDRGIAYLRYYNYGYFSLLEKNEDEVLRNYQSIRYRPPGNTVELIAFLDEEYDKQKDNILFLFAIGFVNYYHADEKRGLQYLKRFSKRATVEHIYPKLVSNVEAILLNKIKRKNNLEIFDSNSSTN